MWWRWWQVGTYSAEWHWQIREWAGYSECAKGKACIIDVVYRQIACHGSVIIWAASLRWLHKHWPTHTHTRTHAPTHVHAHTRIHCGKSEQRWNDLTNCRRNTPHEKEQRLKNDLVLRMAIYCLPACLSVCLSGWVAAATTALLWWVRTLSDYLGASPRRWDDMDKGTRQCLSSVKLLAQCL